MHKIKIITLLLSLVLTVSSCIEPFDTQSLGYKDALVVEALITNEYKTHQIKLSNSFKFEDPVPLPETNAVVYILVDNGDRIDFIEGVEQGVYNSTILFEAEPGKKYQLFVTTSSNKSYKSEAISLTSITQIDNVYAGRTTNDSNEEGVSIYVDSYDASGNSNYYRYEYEETYKIIAPNWVPQDIEITSTVAPYSFNFVDKTTEQQTCYNTRYSTGIAITETTGLTDDVVNKFNLRFIKSIDPIITHRYSILVRQYVQSIDAHSYYNTIKTMSSSQNGLVQNQPGIIPSNIYAINDPDENVLGIFEVASVSEKRLFFNYRDLYIDEDLPPYFTNCTVEIPSLLPNQVGHPDLIEDLISKEWKYLLDNPYYPNIDKPSEGPYELVRTPCGDCTKLGTNVKPDFWYE